MLQHTVTGYIETLVDMIKLCISSPQATIQECIRPTARDLNELWSWNHQLPPTYSFGMHEMISEQSHKHREKVGISSWDGDLTYGQIEQYSTSVACSLKEKGVKLHDVIPVCFEKSRWTIIAVLAVMKIGATLALMDPTLPLARLQNMAKQVGAKLMLSSRKQHELSNSILPSEKNLVVEPDTFSSLSDYQVMPSLETVPASALMYIIFTSGSTGTPKGVKISHQTYTSSAIPRARAVGYTEESRVLDFASYAFDVSIDSMLLTLGNGGCLCIPSDEDRLNDINEVIRRMRINYAGITPSVARILDPDVITSLSGLGLGGEAASARDVTRWGKDTRIIIGYGPCECTIGCTINSSAATGRDYISIGKGNGAAIWIVNPTSHDSLMPVGAVGELLVEGPIVGQGYLNDPEKTAAAFIEDPPWLVAGHEGYAGRRGRLYKTGDLGKYDPDGSGGIIFVGRKDTQVKLRGQRVELGEIESQLNARLPSDATVIAEVIVPQGAGGQPTLVAFVTFKSVSGHGKTPIESFKLDDELRGTISYADAEIGKVLPRYMVPTAYIPVNYIPVLISGKTDRKQLRQFGSTVDLRQLDDDATSNGARELTDIEHRLRQAWSETLKLDSETIRLEDNFFVLGGDSLSAMKLVSVCRSGGLDLTVANTFSYPTLSAMASAVQTINTEAREEMTPFSLISQPEKACLEASQVCGSSPALIKDMYPCTPTQESLFTFSLKSTKVYVAQRVACIPSHISTEAWRKAWEDVVAAIPILSTRLAQLQEPGLQQVVLKEGIPWRYPDNLAQYLKDDRDEKMDLGQSLARYAIVTDSSDGKRYMVWTVHHVLYDGWSEPLILKEVSNALQNKSINTQVQMRDFVKYVRDTDEVAMQEFWRRELKGADGPQFPRLPSRDYLPTPDSIIEHQIHLEPNTGSQFTMATLIRGAWALVASQYTRSNDVVFGETLTGRDIALTGVQSIVGPLIATIPVRINISRSSSIESYLRSIQQSMSARTPYQHMGMQNIRKVSRDAQYACETGTGFVIQPEPEHVGAELGFPQGDVELESLHFNPYPLMLACGIRKNGFRICASFDSNLIEMEQMKRILRQLEKACQELTKDLSRRIKEMSCVPDTELNQIWKWNATPPLSFDSNSNRLKASSTIKQGESYPPAVVSWVCDPRNPALLSPIGCAGELWLEGAFLQGESIEAPSWLSAGSASCAGRKGKLHPTGDVVQLRSDGSLTFMGRKENVVPIQGHAVDISELEDHISKYLQPPTRFAAAITQNQSESLQNSSELIIFIEQDAFVEDVIDLGAGNHEIASDSSDTPGLATTICANIPVRQAVALKKLDKFIRDSLPSYMAPSAYLGVQKLPTNGEQIDHSILNKMATRISKSVLTQFQEGLRQVWADNTSETNLTPEESILRSAWAKVLRMEPEKFDLDDNFFRLGGDSVLAMKLVSSLRAQGHSLTVADIFKHMRLRDAAKVFKLDQNLKERDTPHIPFSTLGQVDIDQYLSKIIRPKLADVNCTIRDVLPVTDSQALDVRGTISIPRTSIQYTMLYLDEDIDLESFLQSCGKLVETHEILRTVFIEHESSFLQVLVSGLDTTVAKRTTNGDLEKYVEELCTVDIESDFQLGSSFLKMTLVEDAEGRACFIIRLSHAQYDGVSLPRLLRDLETLYMGGEIGDFKPFSAYVARVCDKQLEKKGITFWSNLLNDSTMSTICSTPIQSADKAIFHTKQVDISSRPEEITAANLLTASWALVLARRLQKTDVTFGGITSGRNIDIANVENVMGPCYQFTPTRVTFKPQWTSMDLLRFVQTQSGESAAYDFLGFDKIAKHCTKWSPETRFFDSIVHHQDFEDFDTMPFAGGTCRVELSNPHGDAPHPLKAVSFVQDGKTHVGVVGSDRDPEFVDLVLGELVTAIQELATHDSHGVLLDAQLFNITT